MWSIHVIITSHSWSEISPSRSAYEVYLEHLLIICISTDQRRYTSSLVAMGNSSSNHLGIPPGKGPEAVGCTDVMMDHTAQVNTGPSQEKSPVQSQTGRLWTCVCLLHRAALSAFTIRVKSQKEQKNPTGSRAESILMVWQTT